jgi:hypothetical protein
MYRDKERCALGQRFKRARAPFALVDAGRSGLLAWRLLAQRLFTRRLFARWLFTSLLLVHHSWMEV